VNFIDKLTIYRVERAKELMGAGEMSVREIAYTVGYSEPNYFSNLFKRITGLSATEYKKQFSR